MEKNTVVHNTLPKTAWNNLSQAEKAEIIKVAVKHNITDLKTIRQKYNEFAEGGNTSDEDYYTTMYKVAKENNPTWNTMRREEGSPELSIDAEYTRILNDNTYDYKGYYNKYPQSQADAKSHWTDEFKTVWHPTFSVESRYSGKKSEYNPFGLEGGISEKNDMPFIPTAWQRHEANRYGSGGPLVEAANIYGLGDWLKRLFSHRKQMLYKAADGKVFSTAKEAAEHNNTLVKEGKVYLQRESKARGVKYKLIPRKPNTSSTSAKSTILENAMYSNLDANRERTGYRTKIYDIPYGTREIKVKPKDTTLPFTISVNALDSVAKYAGATGTPIETALGLPYHETVFGRLPLYNYGSLGNKYSATDLGNVNYFKAFGSIPAEYLVRDFRYNGDLLINGKRDEPISIETPPIQHALEYLDAGNYNRKADNHTGKVKAAGKSLWNETTGSLQNWWNTEGKGLYIEGAKQRKK